MIAKIIQLASLRARTLLGSPTGAPASLTPSGSGHSTRPGAQAAGAYAQWVCGGPEAPGWGSWWVLGPNSLRAGSPCRRRSGAWRLFKPAPGGSLPLLARLRPPCAQVIPDRSQCAARCLHQLGTSHRAAPLEKRGIDESHFTGSRATGAGLRTTGTHCPGRARATDHRGQSLSWV